MSGLRKNFFIKARDFIHAGEASIRIQHLLKTMQFDPHLVRRIARLEAIRAAAAVRMGLADRAEFATAYRPATPKVAWVARPAGYRTSAGVDVGADRAFTTDLEETDLPPLWRLAALFGGRRRRPNILQILWRTVGAVLRGRGAY